MNGYATMSNKPVEYECAPAPVPRQPIRGELENLIQSLNEARSILDGIVCGITGGQRNDPEGIERKCLSDDINMLGTLAKDCRLFAKALNEILF